MIYVPRGEPSFYLSKNFTTWEFRCPCCREVLVEGTLIASLEKLRELVGEPIYINSGYRCPVHNKDVGGSKNSYHMEGMAADIRCSAKTPRELVRYVKLVKSFRGVGLYAGHVHVDIRGNCAYWISNAVVNCRTL